ncbi:MAG: SulP family inorganic anion transporter, partial [Maribacter sp.]
EWSYFPKRSSKTAFLDSFIFFRTRKVPFFYNSLYDGTKKFHLFDVEFTEGAFIAKEIVKTTILHIQLEEPIPIFTLDKEGLLDFKYRMAGFQDIHLKNHPDFNKRFFLSGEHPKAIQDLFTDELVLFLESNPYYHIESNANAIMVLKKERLSGVLEIKAMLYFGKQLHRLLHNAMLISNC